MAPICTLRRFVRHDLSPDESLDIELGGIFPIENGSAVLPQEAWFEGPDSAPGTSSANHGQDDVIDNRDPTNRSTRYYHNLTVNDEENSMMSPYLFCEATGHVTDLSGHVSGKYLDYLRMHSCNKEDTLSKGRKPVFLPRVYDRLVQVALLSTILPGGTMSGYDETSLINKKLPKELILRVFSHLDIVALCRSAQVCKHWNMLALDGSNWQKVNLFSFQRDVKGPVVENLAKRCGGFLKELSLYGCENIQDGALNTFAEKCHSIEELNLRKCKRLTDATCESLGRHCKRLRTLVLDCCSAIRETGLIAISEGCPNLEALDISWCTNILDNGLEAIAKNCPQLISLICKGCSDLTDDGIGHITRHCKKLRVINLHSCAQLQDQTAVYLGDCHNLEYICMSNCTLITDRALQSIAQGCHLLKDLEVAGCAQLTDSGLNNLAKNCHDLERMDLEDCSLITDQTLINLATGCPHLIALSLSHCELITDEGIRQLAMSLAHQERLKVLELDNCPLVTDFSLEHLREVKTLQNIDLYDCQLITRPGIRRFKHSLPDVAVHAYFAPVTPPVQQQNRRSGFCRCCVIL